MAAQVNQKPMPLPREKAAPRWSGKERDLIEFLRSFEMAAEQPGLTGEEKVVQLGRYCRRDEDQALIEDLPGYPVATRNWDTYKKAILKQFPSVNPETTYSPESLERLVRRTNRKKPFKKASNYAKYTREFTIQSSWLKTNDQISDNERAKTLPQRFSRGHSGSH